jgi:hypothetical protein
VTIGLGSFMIRRDVTSQRGSKAWEIGTVGLGSDGNETRDNEEMGKI